MKKLNKRERIMGSMIAICVPLVYFSIVYSAQSQKVSVLQTSLQTETVKLEAQQAILTDLTTKAIAAKKSVDSNDELKHYLETNRFMSNLLRKLGATEVENGMVLKDIRTLENKKLSNFYQTSMKVEVESSFVALGNFLGALGDAETLIDVKNVVLNRIDSDLKRCTAIIEVDGYFNGGPKL